MHVFLIAAISADGFIAERSDQLSNWTSKADKKLFVELTKRAGVMVMGHTTYQTIGRALPGRKTIVYTHATDLGPDIETTTESPAQLVRRLEAEGYTELAVCGGRSIYTQFLEAELINTLYLTIEPVLFGAGLTLFSQPLFRTLRLREQRQLGPDTIFLDYEVLPS